MNNGSNTEQLAARRKLGFLDTIDEKLDGLRKGLDRLRRAVSTPDAFARRWPTESLERTARNVANRGTVYGIQEMAAWSKDFLARCNKIRFAENPPAEEDLKWLEEQIDGFEKFCRAAVDEAKAAASADDGKTADAVEAEVKGDAAPRTAAASIPGAEPAVVPPARRKVMAVIGTSSIRKQVAFALNVADFDVHEVNLMGDVAERVMEEAPDLIVLDGDDPEPAGIALKKKLSRDPLTDFIPVLTLSSSKGETREFEIPKPINSERLLSEARRVVEIDRAREQGSAGLVDTTLPEMVEYVIRDIRAGVVDAATGPSAGGRFRVVNEGAMIAAIWQLIAQMRRQAAVGSGGKVRFMPTASKRIEMMALAEADEVLDPSTYDVVDDALIAKLSGLDVVIADDDQEIVNVFKETLGEVGMNVRTAKDGKEALSYIRRRPPDLVITDILMPEMDGWELCNRLRRDYALRRIPVIMLSWKEDFLQRVRELRVGADGYMLKESGRHEILSRAAQVLRPRFALERRLSADGDFSGRVEQIGVLAIINSAIKLRPTCRLTFRESWSYYEAALLKGEIVSVNRTGSDGTFDSGVVALERLLGISGGRFLVTKLIGTPRRHFAQGGISAVKDATNRLNGLVSQVADGALMRAAKVVMRKEVVGIYSKVAPTKLKALLNSLVEGESPREIMLRSAVSPEVLETLILDLIRMGAVSNVVGPPSGEAEEQAADELWDEAGAEASKGEAGVESESEIPLSETDLDEMAVDRPIPNVASPPVLLPVPHVAEPEEGVSRIWKVLSIAVLSALALSVYLNLRSCTAEDRTESTQASAEKAVPESVAVDKAVSNKPPPEPVEVAPKAPVAEPSAAAPIEPPPAKVEEAKKVEMSVAVRQGQVEEEKSARRTERERSKSEPSRQSENTGFLAVTVGDGAAGPIDVSVDGKGRGKAPLTVKLSPGLHEVVFSSGGKRTMRMVSVKEGETKSIAAKVMQ